MAGAITEFALPIANSQPRDIVAGPDGALWFVESNTNRIGRITTGGVLAEYVVPTANSVPPSSPFWLYTERAYAHGVISGYSSRPPCVTGAPCFAPGNNVTRGQISKFISNAFFPGCVTPVR